MLTKLTKTVCPRLRGFLSTVMASNSEFDEGLIEEECEDLPELINEMPSTISPLRPSYFSLLFTHVGVFAWFFFVCFLLLFFSLPVISLKFCLCCFYKILGRGNWDNSMNFSTNSV